MDHKKIPDMLKNDYCRYFILLAFLGSNIDRVITQHALNSSKIVLILKFYIFVYLTIINFLLPQL